MRGVFTIQIKKNLGSEHYTYKSKDDVFHEEKMKFIDSIFPRRKCSVLDIGCYKGLLGKYLAGKGYSYDGLDIDKELVKSAKAQGLNVKCCDLDRENIPFNKKYDYITLLDVLEHLHDPEDALNKIRKNLKENGLLLISLPNDFHLLNRIRFLLGKPIYPDSFWAHTHLHTFTRREAFDFLKKQRFKILKTYELPGTFPRFLSFSDRRKLAKFHTGLFSRGTLFILQSLKL